MGRRLQNHFIKHSRISHCGFAIRENIQKILNKKFKDEGHENVYMPMFIQHTSEGQAVPIENSLLLAKALTEKGIPFELHSYQKGPHGLGLLTDDFEGTKARSNALLTWLKINDLK